MIVISMQGAGGSSSAFVNNIHTQFAKARKNEAKRLENPQTNGGIPASFCLLSFIVQLQNHAQLFCLSCDLE